MITLTDVVAGLGLAIVSGVLIAGRNASASGVDSTLPDGSLVLGAAAALLAGLFLATLVVNARSR